MQPLTEKILKNVIGTDPADTFTEGEIDLEGHIIICKDKDKYFEAREKNPQALVIYYPNMKLHYGDRICNAMGYSKNHYKFNSGTYDKSYSVPENMYTEEFKRKNPIFINSVKGQNAFLAHNAIKNIQTTMENSARCQLLMSETSPNKSFDDVMNELQEYKGVSFPLKPPFIDDIEDEHHIPYPDRYTYSWEKHFPEGYKHLGQLMDNIKTMNHFDPEQIFQLITKDTEITKENEAAIIRLKEMIINDISKYNEKFYNKCNEIEEWHKEAKNNIDELEIKRLAFNSNDYKELVYNLMLYQEVAHNSNMLKRQVDEEVYYDLPTEYYDYSTFLKSIKELGNITDSNTLSIVDENIFKMKIIIGNNKDNEILNFIDQKENISKNYLKRFHDSKTDEQQSFATDEYEKNISNFLSGYLEKKGLECDQETFEKILNILIPVTMDKSNLALALAYIQNNTKKKEQEVQKQELNERAINPNIEIASEKNQVMNKFNKIEDQKSKEKREQIEELQELKQEVEMAKQQKMQQEIINSQTTNGFVEDDSETIGFSK